MFMRTNRECQKSQQHISKCLWGSKFISEWSRQWWVWVVILVECSGGETPGSHVADAVALVVKSGEGQPEAKDDRKQKWVEDSLVRFPNCKQVGWGTWLRTHLLNLLLKQLSGIPLRDTVVNGTRQSDFERFFGNSCFSSFVLPSASVEELSLYIFPSPSSAYMAAL